MLSCTDQKERNVVDKLKSLRSQNSMTIHIHGLMARKDRDKMFIVEMARRKDTERFESQNKFSKEALEAAMKEYQDAHKPE